MNRVKFLRKAALRLLALMLCMAAAVPQLRADVTIFARGAAPHLYVYNTDGTAPTDGSRSWPGVQMTESVTTSDGTTWYYVNYEGLNSCSIIFNNGNGGTANQSWDIANVSGTKYYYTNGSNYYLDLTPVKDRTSYAFFENTNNWSGTMYAHCWNGSYSTDWPGDAMTFVGGTNDGRSVYAWSTNSGTPGMIIFDNGNGNGKQTGDLTFNNGYYYYNDGNSTNSNYVGLVFPTLPTPATPHYYITGDAGLGLNGFTYQPTLELTDPDEDGIYTYTSTAQADGTYYFVFATGQGSGQDDGAAWYDFNTHYRVGPTNDGEKVTLNGAYQATQFAGGNNGAYEVTVAAGSVTFYFKPDNMTFKVEGTEITIDYYVVGEDTSIFPNQWSTGTDNLMAEDNGTYTWTSSEVHLNAGTSYSYKVYGDNNTWYPGGSDNATFSVNRPGTYTVTVTFDGTNVNAVATLVQPDPIYIVGDEGLGLTWNYAPTTQMTFDDAEGVFTYTTQVASTTAYHFVFANGQGNNWDDFNGNYRIGPTGETQEVTINGNYQPTQMAANASAEGSYVFTANPGTVTIYFDVANMQFRVEGNVPTYDYTFYVLPSDAGVEPYIYLWYGDNGEYKPANDWPGSLMSETETLGDYNTWHKYSLASSTNVLNAIINNNGNGQTAEIMNLAPGTYYIKWNTTTNDYDLTTQAPTPPVIYIEGSTGLGLTWSAAPTQLMTVDPQTGIYSYTREVTEAGTYNFVFANGQGNSSDDWDNFNANFRIGPTDHSQVITLNEQWYQTQMAGGDNGSYSIAVEPGTVTIYFNPTNMTFKVEGNAKYFTYTFYVLPDDSNVTPYLYLWDPNDIVYSSSYPGDALTETEVLNDGKTWYKKTISITTEYVNAIVNGGGTPEQADGTKTKDITYIDPGTYYIYWTTDRNKDADILYDDNNQPIYTYNHYEMYNDPPTHPGGEFYMIGTYTYGGDYYEYKPDSAAQMKYDGNTGTYYLNNVTLNNNTTFCFSDLLGNDWSDLEGHRYGNGGAEGYTEIDGTNYLEVDASRINRNLPLAPWSNVYGEYRMFTSGIFNVLVNPEQHWVKLIKTDHTTLTPMNIYLEQTPNVKIDNVQDPKTTYTAQMFEDEYWWPLCAYNGAELGEPWESDGDNHYGVYYVGETTTVDGKKWWHWQVTASICEFFFTRTNKEPYQSNVIRRKSGVQWITWDEVDGQTTMTDHTREYFEASANALPSNVVVMEGHYYVYFINTVGWENVYCYAWDDNVDEQGNVDHYYADGYSRVMSQWPGKPCELIGIDPVTGYEVWRYDFGTIAGTEAPNGGILFNDGDPDQGSQTKEQTGDFEYINGGVYDYLGLFDGAYTLNNLIRSASMGVRYTVSNDLVGVYYDKDAQTIIQYTDINGKQVTDTITGALYAKDMNLYGEKSIKPDATYSDYVYDICYATNLPGRSQVMQLRTTYDQSNWIKLIVSPNYDGGNSLPVPKKDRPDLSQYEGHIIPAGKLELFMTDTINPTGHVVNISVGDPMAYEPNVYVPYSFNDSYVFTYTHQDWAHEPYEGVYLTRPVVTWITNDEGNVISGTVVNKPDESRLYKMFYVAPKPQEVAYVTWIVYDNNNKDRMYGGYNHDSYQPYSPVASGLPEDPGRFYAPSNWKRSIPISPDEYSIVQGLDYEEWETYYHQKISDVSNGYMQLGGVKVNWSLFDEDKVGLPWWQIFQPGQAYKLKAIVRYAHGIDKNDVLYKPSNGFIDWDDHDHDADNTVFNAPRRADSGGNGQGGYANMYFTSEYDMEDSKFILFPIEASPAKAEGSSMGNVTTVNEVAAPAPTVTGVRYYNLMGVGSDKPFNGINIVVTTYSDGSRTSRKVLR